jgi:hypothetical protein
MVHESRDAGGGLCWAIAPVLAAVIPTLSAADEVSTRMFDFMMHRLLKVPTGADAK